MGIRHVEEIGVALRAANEAAFTSPVMQYEQAAIMTGPAAITEQATLDEYLLIARSTKPQLADKSILQRFAQAIQLYHPTGHSATSTGSNAGSASLNSNTRFYASESVPAQA